jgi:putative membrane protein
VTAVALVWALAAAAVAYPLAAARTGSWPLVRTAAWLAGLAAAAIGVSVPDHVTGHLLLGMLAPLLLVRSAPVTLALRALPVAEARRLSRVLRSRPARVLTAPAVAAVLDIGGLWLIFTTDLHEHPLTQLHVLGAGYLFTAAIVGVDPSPHRARLGTRAAVLVLASAAHGVLAKHLYESDPDAAMLMYYGGDVIEVALAVLLGREWLSAAWRGRPGGPQHTQVEQREDAAHHGDEPDLLDGGDHREGDRGQGQHDEGQPQAAGHRSGQSAHGRHAPMS